MLGCLGFFIFRGSRRAGKKPNHLKKGFSFWGGGNFRLLRAVLLRDVLINVFPQICHIIFEKAFFLTKVISVRKKPTFVFSVEKSVSKVKSPN